MKKYVLILGLFLSFNANAANTCGDDLDNNCWDCGKTADDLCTARLEGTNLAITGTGEMKDYGWYQSEGVYVTTAPWGNTPKGNTEITDITIDGITRVGNSAFLGATNLENITFSDSVVEIGANALHSSGLTHLELPANLKVLEGGSIQNIKSIDNIIIPDSVETIGEAVFWGWDLKSIVIPDSVKTLGPKVFKNVASLQSVVIGDGVISIDKNSFIGTDAYIYCQDTSERSCRDLIGENNPEALDKLKRYTVDSNGKIKVGSKTYDSFDDLPKYVLRRIYTLKEAEEASGKVNRVSIRYK
ncbi:MAG: leucine-rich repeat domain-containing protein [Alphaproteobacteria bacterium]|nr:leucine-rich repeat domain-containing protein [Alphaproteobacteria bacterium]